MTKPQLRLHIKKKETKKQTIALWSISANPKWLLLVCKCVRWVWIFLSDITSSERTVYSAAGTSALCRWKVSWCLHTDYPECTLMFEYIFIILNTAAKGEKKKKSYRFESLDVHISALQIVPLGVWNNLN